MDDTADDTLTDEQTHALKKLSRSIEVYRQQSPSGSLLFCEMFLLVAGQGPLTVSEIARVLNLPLGTASGVLRDLGEGGTRFPKLHGPPPKLLARVSNPQDARSKLAALTLKGALLATEMRAALGQ